jgi:hypothetical protein
MPLNFSSGHLLNLFLSSLKINISPDCWHRISSPGIGVADLERGHLDMGWRVLKKKQTWNTEIPKN